MARDVVVVVVGAAYYTEILQNEFILTHYYAVKHVIHYATKIQSVMAHSSFLSFVFGQNCLSSGLRRRSNFHDFAVCVGVGRRTRYPWTAALAETSNPVEAVDVER